jgi:hypothetical protein
MSVHYIIQKTLITNKCTKSFFINYNTLCTAALCTAPQCTVILAQLYSATQCNDNGKFLPEDDPAGSKYVGVCYN